ncbi:ABC transporter permease [Microbacterium lacus]|uniref:ABC transporter permease n=1 Tax=Microbacterium lacus TaxID=415217 RepID=UPI003850D90F
MSSSPDNAALERFQRLRELPMRPVGASTGMRPKDIAASVRALGAQREMLDLLIRRDLKAKYKDSTLGFFWSLARPLIQLAIYFVVVGQFIGAAKGIDDFAVYIFSGLVAVGLFTEIVVGGTGSILANAGLVKKVYLPREVFPLASVGSALFNFLVQLVVLIGATLLVGKPPLHIEILYVFPAVAVLLVYGTALGLLFSAVNVYLRDVQYLVEVGTLLLFWASPVVYSWQMVSDILGPSFLLEVYTNNPLTLAVIGFQEAFWVAGADAVQPDELLLRLAIALVIGLVLLFTSHRVFLRLQGNFAQEI